MNGNNQVFNQNFNPQGANSFGTEASSPLDVKDLGILQDELIHEALAYKKWTVYESLFQDQQLKQIAQRTATHHKQHFDTLQSYLNSHR